MLPFPILLLFVCGECVIGFAYMFVCFVWCVIQVS